MKRSGFTLIELSIVLIIIGLIIGGVMKGKDLIRSADQKKIYNTWVRQWQVVANTYQDRTGGILGDGEVNGGKTGKNPDGRCDNVLLYNTTTVQDKLKAIGLDIPVSNIATSNGGSHEIQGKYTAQTAQAHLQFVNNKNVLRIDNVPTDVAIAFDTMTDGTADPQAGAFKIFNDGATTWPDASKTGHKAVNVTLEL